MQFDVLDQTNELLDETLYFDVIIRDKNDNPPVFEPEVLNVQVPENTKEGEDHVHYCLKMSAPKRQQISLIDFWCIELLDSAHPFTVLFMVHVASIFMLFKKKTAVIILAPTLCYN